MCQKGECARKPTSQNLRARRRDVAQTWVYNLIESLALIHSLMTVGREHVYAGSEGMILDTRLYLSTGRTMLATSMPS